MFVCCPGMDERSVTHGDSALLLAVGVAFFFGGFFTVLVVCWGMTAGNGGKQKQK